MSIQLQNISTMHKMETQEKLAAEPSKGHVKFDTHFQELVFGSQDKATELILENKDNCFMAYRFRSLPNANFIVKPCYRGLLPPRDVLAVEITYANDAGVPTNLADGKEFSLEITTIPKVGSGVTRKTVDSSTVWKNTDTQQITEIRLPYTFSVKNEKPGPSIVSLYGPPRTLVERLNRVIERVKREKLIFDILIMLLAIFAAGVMAGGMMASSGSSHSAGSTSKNATKSGKY